METKKITSCFYFIKTIETVFPVFPWSYGNTSESLEKLEIAVETLACARISTAFLVLPNFTRVMETRKTFSIWYVYHDKKE